MRFARLMEGLASVTRSIMTLFAFLRSCGLSEGDGPALIGFGQPTFCGGAVPG